MKTVRLRKKSLVKTASKCRVQGLLLPYHTAIHNSGANQVD